MRLEGDLTITTALMRVFPINKERTSTAIVFPKLARVQLEETCPKFSERDLCCFWKYMHGYDIDEAYHKSVGSVRIGKQILTYPRVLIMRQDPIELPNIKERSKQLLSQVGCILKKEMSLHMRHFGLKFK